MRRGRLRPCRGAGDGSFQAQHPPIGSRIRAGAREVIERVLGHADDVALDELRAFRRALLRVLDAALPFEHCPAVVVVLRELGKDAVEVDLAIAERAEAPRALDPGLITR